MYTRDAGQQRIQIKSTVFPELQMPGKNACRLMTTPRLAESRILCVSKCTRIHRRPSRWTDGDIGV
jgi:hypothetical protein